jgi:hypothetical protein
MCGGERERENNFPRTAMTSRYWMMDDLNYLTNYRHGRLLMEREEWERGNGNGEDIKILFCQFKNKF